MTPAKKKDWPLIIASLLMLSGFAVLLFVGLALVGSGTRTEPWIWASLGLIGAGSVTAACLAVWRTLRFFVRPSAPAEESPEEAAKVPARKPALVMFLAGAALATAAIWGSTQQGPLWLQDVTLFAFLIGVAVGLTGLGKLLTRLIRTMEQRRRR